MNLVAFSDLTPDQLAVAAVILREAIHGTSYKASGEAEEETSSFLTDPERFAIAAVDGDRVLGWVGGIRGYSHALELHPLVVDPAHQRQGIGRVTSLLWRPRRAPRASSLSIWELTTTIAAATSSEPNCSQTLWPSSPRSRQPSKVTPSSSTSSRASSRLACCPTPMALANPISSWPSEWVVRQGYPFSDPIIRSA